MYLAPFLPSFKKSNFFIDNKNRKYLKLYSVIFFIQKTRLPQAKYTRSAKLTRETARVFLRETEINRDFQISIMNEGAVP